MLVSLFCFKTGDLSLVISAACVAYESGRTGGSAIPTMLVKEDEITREVERGSGWMRL